MSPFTPKAAIQLMAPRTWGASVTPALLGALLALSLDGVFDGTMFFCTFAASVLLQSSVNTLNDYRDFITGADTAENCTDPTDASLVYNGFKPGTALVFGLCLMAAAALLGLHVVWVRGLPPLILGCAGIAAVLLYSLGKKPLSHIPAGELTSGLVMGLLITMACFQAQTGRIDPRILLCSVPSVLTIAGIMLANNTSDIERDTLAGRRTFSVLAGRRRAALILKLLWLPAAAIQLCCLYLYFPASFPALPIPALWWSFSVLRLLRLSFRPEERTASMSAATGLHRSFQLGFAALIAADTILKTI